MIIKNLPKKKNLEVCVFDVQGDHLEDHIAKHKQKLFKFRLQENKKTGVFSANVKDKKEITYIFKTVFNQRKNSQLGTDHNLVIQLKLSSRKSFNFVDFCSFEKENLDKFGFLRDLLEDKLGEDIQIGSLGRILLRGSKGIFRFFLVNHLMSVEDKDTIMRLIKFLSSG